MATSNALTVSSSTPDSIPLWVKLAYAGFLAVWIPVYWQAYGWQNFLWLCDTANILIGIALWLESPLLVAAQAAGVLLVQLAWIIDVLFRLFLGVHPIGGTEYMFDGDAPLGVRLLSLFHVVVPILLLWAIGRLGYNRHGWKLQTVIIALLLSATFWLTEPELNINWIHRPFGVEQTLVSPAEFVLVEICALGLVVCFPTHLVLEAFFRRKVA